MVLAKRNSVAESTVRNEVHQEGEVRRRRWPLVLVELFVVLVVGSQLGRRLVTVNTTRSIDPGLYLASGEEVAVGQLVSFRVPKSARPYFSGRAGRPIEDAAEWFLIKPVFAGPGDTVDTTGNRVRVNGINCGPIYTRDAAGRPLPSWRQRQVLGAGEWFVLSRRDPGSLDGRYFGVIRGEEIECVRQPLVRWGVHNQSWQWLGEYVDRPLRKSLSEPEVAPR